MTSLRRYWLQSAVDRPQRVILVAALALAGCRDVVATVPANPPTDLVAALTGPTTVQLNWTSRPANERVSGYLVYRNGQLAGETATSNYTDSGLLEYFTLTYTVSAKTLLGGESSQSTPVTVTTTDGTAPRLIQTVVADGETLSFPRNSVILLVFSEAMDSASINASTLAVRSTLTGEFIPGTVQYFKAQQHAEFRPARQLPDLTSVTITMSAGMRDIAGNGLAAPFSVVLTTFETVPPRVVTVEPANGATGVPLSPTISITFSEPMRESTLSNVYLTSNGLIPTSRSYDSSTNVLSLTPLAPLQGKRLYFIVIPSSVADLNGNRMNPFLLLTFSTGEATPSP